MNNQKQLLLSSTYIMSTIRRLTSIKDLTDSEFQTLVFKAQEFKNPSRKVTQKALLPTTRSYLEEPVPCCSVRDQPEPEFPMRVPYLTLDVSQCF